MSDAPESHWCYHCNKRVAVGTLDDLVLCCECNKGFAGSIQAIPAAYSSPEPPPPLSRDSIGIEELLDELLWQIGSDIGNPGDYDYIDEALFQNLLEGDDGGRGRRGAPPAAKSAIEALETFEVGSTSSEEGERMIVVCAVCKDTMVMGEIGKKLPCGHCYHGNCILPWLGTRNSCPVCRFQLQTDDAEYERKRSREEPPLTDFAGASSSSSSSKRGRKEKNDHHVVETRRRSTRTRKPNSRFMD